MLTFNKVLRAISFSYERWVIVADFSALCTFCPNAPKAGCQPPVLYAIAGLSHQPFLLCRSRNMSQQMGDSHRRFLQTMMGCAVVTGREAESLYRYCCVAHKGESFEI